MVQRASKQLTVRGKRILANRRARVARLTSSLWQRCPDEHLLALFRDLLPGFRRLCLAELSKGIEPTAAVHHAFQEICDLLVAAADGPPDKAAGGDILPEDCLVRLERGGADSLGLQGIASLLGMLMHLSIDPDRRHPLVNRRRPHQPNSTYPTSAAVTRLLAEYALVHLLKEPVPARCRRAADAEHYAARVLRFRLLDPSMESGQLLLEVAVRLAAQVHREHPPGSRAARRLNRALLGRLCSHCLWGIDRHPSSVVAVRAAFSLLATQLGISDLEPLNLLVGDSLAAFRDGRLGRFDGVLNNPPWGELGGSKGRERIRRFATVEHRVESYVAFTEGSLCSLRPGGVYGFVLPSQAIATRNSRRLRKLLAGASQLKHLVLLPRAAFAQATVRGLVLLGQAGTPAAPSGASVRVTLYPLLRRLDARAPVCTRRVPLKRLGKGTWTALWGEPATPPGRAPTVELDALATVLGGVVMYRRGRGRPPQTREIVDRKPYNFPEPRPGTVPAVRGRDVDEFRLREPENFVRLGPWLAETGPHGSLLQRERVFVRELCRRDGKLNAAVAVPGLLPLCSVLAVLPERIGSEVLVAILNSRVAARYVRSHTASFSKVDFQRIKIGELRRLPIPISALAARHRLRLGFGPPTRREIGLQARVANLTRKLAVTEGTAASGAELRERLEDLVAKLYDGPGTPENER